MIYMSDYFVKIVDFVNISIFFFFLSENYNSPSISTRRNSPFPADVLEAAYAIGETQHRKRQKNNSGKDDSSENSSSSGPPLNKITPVAMDFNENDPLPDIFINNFEQNSNFDEFICSLLMNNSEILHKSKTVCPISDIELELPVSDIQSNFETISYEENAIDEISLYQSLINPNEKPQKTIDLKSNLPYTLPKFKMWRNIQKSYKVVPSSEQCENNNNFTDFIGNVSYKCMVIFPASSYYKDIEQLLPITMPESTLLMSQDVDLYSIDDVNNIRSENSALNNKQISLDTIVNERIRLQSKIKKLMDVDEHIYYPFVGFKDPLTSQIPPLPSKSLNILFSVLHAIELNVDGMDSAGLPISTSLKYFIPFLNTALMHPELDYHIICTSVHIGFYFELSHAINRIKHYLKSPDFIQLKAAFEIFKSVCPEQIPLLHTEVARFANSVETGAFLCLPARLLQSVSSVHSLPNNLLVYESAIEYMNGHVKAPQYTGMSSVPLYTCKFVKEGKFINVIVSKFPHHRNMIGISPQYWPVLERLRIPNTPDIRPIKEMNTLSFQVNTCRDPQIDPPLVFTPGTSSFMFM